ncbi:MAG: hypothetical protein AAGH83_02960 [Pseudomonadota bacterium]
MKDLIGATLLAVMPVAAAAQEVCAPFTVGTNDERIVETLDAEPEGPSLGDVRLGERPLVDADGTPVGTNRWMVTVLDPDHGGEPSHLLVKNYAIFDTGVLISEIIVTQTVDDIHATDRTIAAESDGVVLGGTGVFASAHGTVRLLRQSDGPIDLDLQFDISCD